MLRNIFEQFLFVFLSYFLLSARDFLFTENNATAPDLFHMYNVRKNIQAIHLPC
jgi:hypothetical protein